MRREAPLADASRTKTYGDLRIEIENVAAVMPSASGKTHRRAASIAHDSIA